MTVQVRVQTDTEIPPQIYLPPHISKIVKYSKCHVSNDIDPNPVVVF